jgi:hypothetical protein
MLCLNDRLSEDEKDQYWGLIPALLFARSNIG